MPVDRYGQLDNLQYGDHLCPIYDSRTQQTAFAVATLRHGLWRNERCLFAAEEETLAEVLQHLVRLGIDANRERERGRLLLLTPSAVYQSRGQFTPQGMIEFLLESEAAALRDGFAGLRTVGQMAALLEAAVAPETLIEYEALLNRHLVDRRVVAFCQYHRPRFDDALIHDILRTHPLVVLDDHPFLNPHYEPPELLLLLRGEADTTAAYKRQRVGWWLQRLKSSEALAQRPQSAARQRTAELEDSEARYRQMIESMPQMVWMARGDGYSDYLNQRACRQLGVASDIVRGWGWITLLHPEDRHRSRQLWERASAAGMPYQNEHRVRQADGSYRWYLSQAVPLRDAQSRITRWIGTWTDIDERKRAEEALRAGESRKAAILRSALDCIVTADHRGRILEFNPAAERTFGHRREDVLGQSVADVLIPASLREQHARGLDRYLRTGVSSILCRRIEVTALHADGREFPVELTVTAITDGEKPLFTAFIRDISERQRVEREHLRLLHDLGERVKELRLLHQTATLIQDETLEPDQLFVELVALIPGGWQFPDITVSRITYGEQVHASPAFRLTPWVQSATFLAAGLPGCIEVAYLEERAAAAEGPFLEEERRLLVSLCELLRGFLERKQSTRVLQTSEERYRTLLNCIPDPLFVYDRQTLQYLLVNDAAVRNYGYTREEFLQMTVRDIRPPEDLSKLELVLSQATDSYEYRGIWRHRRKDGSHLDVRITAHVLELDGRPACIILAHDVTEQLQAERDLRRTTDLLRAVAEGSPDAIFVKDRQGKYLLFNPAAARFVGRPAEEVIGRVDGDLFDADSARLVQSRDRRVMETGQIETEEEVLTAAGVTRTFLATKAPYRDADGSIIGVIGISRDITDRKQAEADLSLRDRAIQAVTQGIIITDPNQPDNPIIDVNAGFEELSGYTRGDILGRNCRFLQGPNTDPDTVGQVREAIQSGQPCHVEILNYRRDSTPFWNELSISPVRDDAGRLTHFIGVQTDVTARKALEEQLHQVQKMEAIGQLAGGVAHDFNNLLTIISGYTELLLDTTPAGEPNRELLDEIHRAAERSAALTRQLLAFSRKQVLAPRLIDLNDVVRDTEKLLRRLIGEDIRLTTELHPEPLSVRADPGQMEQVLMNLAVNARDAMPQGGDLTIRTSRVVWTDPEAIQRPGGRPGPYAVLEVSDTGSGMPDEVRRRVFEPFFTTKEAGRGTGLGLSVVHGIVLQSEGHIDLESTLGHGTTFRIFLPHIQERAAGFEPPSLLTNAAPGTGTVLVVEDEAALRALSSRILRQSGYVVLEAGDGEQALRIAAEHPGTIDLLVTDVVMPVMGGRNLAERLCDLRPGIKVLYVSGYTDDAIVRHGVAQDQVAFLQKPFTPQALSEQTRQLLAR
jgi:two-component system, cell cycle sensor histidine kinase and response regulator CckA